MAVASLIELVLQATSHSNNTRETNEKQIIIKSPRRKRKNMSSRVGQFGQISEINDHLCLSGAGVLKPDKIRSKKINCIVNATTEEPNGYISGIDYLKIRIEDVPTARLDSYFDMVADKIKAVRDRGGRTLVHCMAGVSRSATLCIVYLMKHLKLSLRQSYYHIKACRSIIRPNCGFWKQMIEYELRLTGGNTVKLIPGRHAMEMIPDVYLEELKRYSLPVSHSNSMGSPFRYRSYGSPNLSASNGSSTIRRATLGGLSSTGRYSNSIGSRRSYSPAVNSSYSRNNNNNSGYYYSNGIGPLSSSVSALALAGTPIKNKLKGNIFSNFYQDTHDIMFPSF